MTDMMKKIPLLSFSGNSNNFKIKISRELETKIRTLCILSPNREWSGVLFYTFEGDFKNGVTIHADNLYLMDQGSTVHTEFDLDAPEITKYLFTEGLADHCMGLIHSHNTMSAFFSGEDSQTLLDHGCHMHNFVSLVVNNEGKYVARLTRQVSFKGVETKSLRGVNKSPLFNTEEVEEDVLSKDTSTELSSYYIEYVDLAVEKPSVSISNEIITRFIEVNDKCSRISEKVGPKPAFDEVMEFRKNAGYKKEITKQGSLFPEDDFGEDTLETLVTEDMQRELRMVPWERIGFNNCVLQLLSGSPFTEETAIDSKYISMVNAMYKKRFPEERDFAVWFDMWLDFIISDFYVPLTYTRPRVFTDGEEMLVYKLYDFILNKPLVYKQSMLNSLFNRMAL